MNAVGEQMMQDLNKNEGSDFNAAPEGLTVPGQDASAPAAAAPAASSDASQGPVGEEVDPMKAIQDSLGKK